MSLRRVQAEWVLPIGVACMVVAFAAGSGSEPWVKRYGLDVRWVVLLVVCAAALVAAGRHLRRTQRPPARGLLRFGVLAASFLAIAFVSTAWSVAPRLTFERACSLAVLFTLGAALAVVTADDTAARVRLFQGLAAGAIAVGVLGLVVVVLDYDASGIQYPNAWRYRGFTENPNTIAILAAASLPIVVALALRTQTVRRQAAWLIGALLLIGSVVASESRGGMLAACAGTLVVVVFGVRGVKQRAVAVTALVLAFGGGIALRQALQTPAPGFTYQVSAPTAPPAREATKPESRPGTKPNSSSGTNPKSSSRAKPASRPNRNRSSSSGRGTRGNGRPETRARGSGRPKAQAGGRRKNKRHQAAPAPYVRLTTRTAELPAEQDEIGHPALTKTATTTAGSGRVAAWEGSLEQIADRPILGYGFGTEENVFVDRWYYFQGGTNENSYLGLLMQVGAVGLAFVLAMACLLIVGGLRALPLLHDDDRLLVITSLGVIVAAATIMLIQSYLYSVGNVASATVWITIFVLSPVALAPRATRARVRASAQERVAA
ncbi:MAG: hypothetical protein ACJ74N_17060 [Gaiellaceae bacterium]